MFPLPYSQISQPFKDIFDTFGRHLEEIHTLWTQFGKKQDKIATLHEDDEDLAYSAWRRRSLAVYPVGGRFVVKGGFQPERLARVVNRDPIGLDVLITIWRAIPASRLLGSEVGAIRRIEWVRYGVSGVSWSRDHAQIRRIFLDGYGVLVVRTVIFKISSFKL
ncbi:hypothetical protein Tco_1072290 [Tanacetum coccineum]